MTTPAGIHHVTAVGGDPKQTYDFYTRTIGLRFVKKTVNFDDPHTYHLYFGNETGEPGSALTFFPWAHAAAGRLGAGAAGATAFLAPEGSVGFWIDRLVSFGVPHESPEKRFGETTIALRDPDGMALEIVFSSSAGALPAWSSGPVPAEHAIRGFAGATLWVDDPAGTIDVLTNALGFTPAGEDAGHLRFTADGHALGRTIEIKTVRGFLPARLGRGSVHHVAFRADDDAAQAEIAKKLAALGLRATPQQDRNYFRSIYFREPGGVLFEIATDGPGFMIDESMEALGRGLKLPPFYEARRAEIEASLPALDVV